MGTVQTAPNYAPGIEITGPVTAEYAEILTPQAMDFVATLQRRFNDRRLELLQRRHRIQDEINAGNFPRFEPETKHIREASWQAAPLPADLQDRRVEITGPTDRKMLINALNSGASIYMADFEDANSPTWQNMVEGQLNLRDAINRTISFVSPEGKRYQLNEQTAVLMVRPRGWHLPEKHVLIDGQEVSGSLFDFGLYFYHNAQNLIDRGTGPYFYVAKLENHLEARLWNEVFTFAEEQRGIPHGTIRATVLLETILAAFQMDEILFELREHSSGLNAGRWDYIFSIIKKFRQFPQFVLPDRAMVTMRTHMMRSYDLLTIKTAHHRDADAIGGMAAYIPVRSDPIANQEAIHQVVLDKEREAGDGHDGTWVAHPGLVPVAKEVFDRLMPTPNQIDRKRDDVQVSEQDLLTVPPGEITEPGLRLNINVAIQYLESWLGGQGAVAIFNLMEDAATAEISRAQIWQWIHQHVKLADGRPVTKEMVRTFLGEELDRIKEMVGAESFAGGRYDLAAKLFDEVAIQDQWVDFLTLVGYQYLP